MADTGSVTANQQNHPVTTWFVGLRNLGNQALQLFNPVACTTLSALGVSIITYSPKFRRCYSLVQIISTFFLTMYVALTAVVAFGSWATYRVVHAPIAPHRHLYFVQRVIAMSFVLWMWSETVRAEDYMFGLGIGTLVVQGQYLARLQAYNISVKSIISGLVCLASIIVYHESATNWGSLIGLIVLDNLQHYLKPKISLTSLVNGKLGSKEVI